MSLKDNYIEILYRIVSAFAKRIMDYIYSSASNYVAMDSILEVLIMELK